jgi:flagellar basal-body rod protein FlgF
MVSGKYSALAGAISREQSINNISANLANVNTTGYKRSLVSFESLLKGERQINEAKGINYSRVRQNYTDFTEGAIRPTDNPYDMAIQGEGFFKVLGPDGPLYTRRGDFLVNQDGTLRTSNGMPVLDEGNGEITIPDTDIGEIAVSDEGGIYILTPDGNRAEVAQLGVVGVNDPSLLKRRADTTFELLPGGEETDVENYSIVQGSLEVSNVNMTDEMAKMINSYRTFETYHKVLKSYSTLGEEQNDLGTIS